MRTLWAAVVLAWLPFGATLAQGTAPETVTLTIEQSRTVAVQALSKGQPQVAAQIAAGLLQRDGDDAFAHFVLARAMQQMQQPAQGRRAAARAFRYARTPTQKYEASQLAATLAYEQGAHGIAQIWLRRSWNHAPTPQARTILKKDYAVLRHLNPWQVQGRLSIIPSDNVNNGAKDPYMQIEGVPFVGVLSGDALALSGIKAVADLSLGYRLRQSRRDQTRVTGRLYLNRVALSDEARSIAPTARNGDFAYSDFALGVEHQMAHATGAQSLYSLSVGRLWYAGAPYQDRVGLGLTHLRPLDDAGRVRYTGQFQRATPASGAAELYQFDLGADWQHPLSNGDLWGYGLSARLVDTRTAIHQENRATGHVTYGFGKSVGPAKVSLTLGVSVGHYPNYRLGTIVVPGGRDDRSVFGSASFTFDTLDYAGFAPALTLQAQRTRSNVSRFSSDAISVSLGFVSRF